MTEIMQQNEKKNESQDAFIEVKSRNHERTQNRGPQAVKRMCAHLVEAGDATKVGGMIKNDLKRIRDEAGGTVFVSYKTEAEAKEIGKWLEDHPELALMEDMGAGWYIWSYKPEVTLKVKAEIKAASDRRDAKQRAWERRNDRTPVLVTGPPRRQSQMKPNESDFPTTLGEGRTQPVRGAWGEKKEAVLRGEMKTKAKPSTAGGQTTAKKGRVVMVDGPMPALNEDKVVPSVAQEGDSAWDE